MPTAVRIIMLGRQGAGKGTQCRLLSEHFGAPHISTGEMLRAAIRQDTVVGRAVKKVLDEGNLVEDGLMVSLVQGRIGETDARVGGYILDGFPRTVSQATSFDHITEVRPVDIVINLEVKRELVLSRLSARRTCEQCEANYISDGNDPKPWKCTKCGGLVHQRDDDTPEAISHRLDLYDSLTSPLIDYYMSKSRLVVVDGLGTTEEVFERLATAVKAAQA
jgi:adenylate kinase